VTGSLPFRRFFYFFIFLFLPHLHQYRAGKSPKMRLLFEIRRCWLCILLRLFCLGFLSSGTIYSLTTMFCVHSIKLTKVRFPQQHQEFLCWLGTATYHYIAPYSCGQANTSNFLAHLCGPPQVPKMLGK